MRLTKEELIEKFKNYAGEDVTSDAAIEILEDISDSVGVEKEETEEGEGGEDWEAKYKELDESWRKKYAERFSEPGDKEKEPEEEKEEEEETEETEEERAENVTYEDLFEEKKKKED
ncbi:MAG: hypothetical protein II220_02895 [Spirochaetales bacterium]|nr:hypothetical protein [Spirochaetales bacterium]